MKHTKGDLQQMQSLPLEAKVAMTEYINKSDFIKWIESTFCKPCKEKGDDRDGVCCRVCQYNDWIAYVDSFQGGNDY